MYIPSKKKLLSVVGGMAAGILVERVLKSDAVHHAAVKTMAKGINLKKSAVECYESIKEDADDLAYEARREARRQKEATIVVEEAVDEA